MSLTAQIDTPERSGQSLSVPVAAATALYAGNLAALDSAGRAVAATDAAGIRVLGRVEADADNSGGAAAAINATIKRGVFRYANSAGSAVTQAYLGKVVFVEDCETVAITSTHKIPAGVVVEVATDGVWIDTAAAQPGTVAFTQGSTNGVAGAAADLAALKAETELLGDDVRAVIAALQARGILK
jgi:hypothetical protein